MTMIRGWGVLCVALMSLGRSEAAHSLRQQQQPQQRRILDEEVTRTDLVRLIPFDVQIAVTFQEQSDLERLNVYAFMDIITDWMSKSFETKSTTSPIMDDNNSTYFDSVALELADQRIQTSTSTSATSLPLALLTTSYEGVSLWERVGAGTPPMDPELVELMQRATFLEDNALLRMLQSADPDVVGVMSEDSIIDVRAFITPPNTNPEEGNDENPEGTEDNKNLEIIIIIAIVVACLAFGLLIFAVVWAWRSDHKPKAASSRASSSKKSAASSKKKSSAAKQNLPQDGTGSESEMGVDVSSPKQGKSARKSPSMAKTKEVPASPVVSSAVGVSNHTRSSNSSKNNNSKNNATQDPQYSESIVSEDISTSLTAYYKSGMYSGNDSRAGGAGPGGGELNDAASMCSMDSYGYSLDGYAPSLGPAQGGYPVGPLQAARDAPMPLGDEDDANAAPAEEVEDYEAQ
mmetsp:Transcript_6663/g.12116  ORF Transcript_6663/g.12116 Transcript_6663/m.12116 type:complete len:461 (-) Transcript_6663:141-1523(-)